MDNEEERWAVIWATLWAHTHYSVGTGVLAYTAQRRVRPSDVYSCACTRRALCLSSRASKALRARGPEATWQLSRRRGQQRLGSSAVAVAWIPPGGTLALAPGFLAVARPHRRTGAQTPSLKGPVFPQQRCNPRATLHLVGSHDPEELAAFVCLQ